MGIWDRMRRRKETAVVRDEAVITVRRSFTLTIEGGVDPTAVFEMTLAPAQGWIERIAARLRGEK